MTQDNNKLSERSPVQIAETRDLEPEQGLFEMNFACKVIWPKSRLDDTP